MTGHTAAPQHFGYRHIRFGHLTFRFHIRRTMITCGLAILLCVLALLSLGLGSQNIGTGHIAAALFDRGELQDFEYAILVQLRLPRLVLAVICGAMLGLSGAAMQALTRNGLADPGLLGVREGSMLAVLVVMLVAPAMPLALRPVIGTFGGLIVACAAIALARSVSGLRFVLVGIGISWLLSSIIAMMLVSLDSSDAQSLLLWIAGSLSSASWNVMPVAATFLCLAGVLLLGTAGASDVATLGPKTATGLGVCLRRTSTIQLFAATLLSATCVSTIGGIGFIGLIAPHLAKLVNGNSNQFSVLINSAFWGGLLLLAADTIGRIAFLPLQLPAGVILAVIGVPILLVLLWKRRNAL